MKPDKVQSTSSSSDASLNLTCHERNKESSFLCPCSIDSESKEATTIGNNKQVISRYDDISVEKRSNSDDREVNVCVSRADDDEEQSKLCLIKCKNNIENDESPLITTKSSEGLISVKKNGSTLVFQKKPPTTANKNILKKNYSLQNWQIPNNSSSVWTKKTESFSDIAVNNDNLELSDKSPYETVESANNASESKMKSTAEQSTVSRRWRIEEFLKNLVGKRPSSLTSTTTMTNQRKRTPSEQDIMENQSLMKISMKPDLSSSMVSLNKERMPYKSTTSLNSMSIVNQKLWSVMPLLNRKDAGNSCNNLLSNDKIKVAKKQSKSIHNLLEPIKPMNRLRNSKSCYIAAESCSRCSSLFSLSALGSNASLNYTKKSHLSSLDYGRFDNVDGSSQNLLDDDMIQIKVLDDNSKSKSDIQVTCKLCLSDCTEDQITKIELCGCFFCIECMKAYVEFEIAEGAYELSCPDALCSSQGIVSFEEITKLASPSLVAKHHRYRLNREVELDKNRVWCPNRNCETICSIGPVDKLKSQQPSSSNLSFVVPRAVLCLTCKMEFCSNCKKEWHPLMTCEENGKKLGSRQDSIMLFDNDLIKCCPMCSVPIEKDEGCAQMMCKRCKHVFCWYCLSSLDDDFLLRHYDKGPCKNKLGHSRASVVWHRAQVIGIFAGFGILLLAASPLLLLAAPCIVCCKCKIEESSSTSKVLDNVQLDEL